jgi:hypothetical protein
MRKTVTRIAFAALAIPALAFGAPATAMADSYFNAEATAAGKYGAASKSITAVAKDGHGHHHGGKSFFHHESTSAGWNGATSQSTTSAAH